jgi:hypothetical protein
MKVAISREFSELAMELTQKGYEVQIENENNDSCDVIICDLKNDDLAKYNFGNVYKKEGTLIIDKGHKSTDEIENIIKSREYNFKDKYNYNFT